MASEYQSLVKTTESRDLGTCIQNLINDNIQALQTAFLAKITKINQNKICFEKIIKSNEKEAKIVVNNCLIGFPYSQEWQVQYKLKVGDIGLCITLERDISDYKQSGAGGISPTKRFKDINDSIFIPFSLYRTLNNADINFVIENASKSCIMQFDNQEMGLFKAKLLTLQSENTTLKKKLVELAGLLESMASGATSTQIDNTHRHTTAPSSIGSFNSWADSLNDLFKD